MTFTGTLIEDLMTMVERADRRTQAHRALVNGAETMPAETSVESWFASAQQNPEYDLKLIGVA